MANITAEKIKTTIAKSDKERDLEIARINA